MSLKDYHRKRDFRKTPEPRGGKTVRRSQLAFVIQKHAASHLHYDFRLELDGVLKSWAVPKGPDLDPAVKRLAMQVEDHPVEYGDFEGVIPQGEYGGGTVLLWDRGTWEAAGDARKGLREGRLKFLLHGEKLRGGWMLVRRGGQSEASDERHWFLFKERDEFAKAGTSITEEQPLSVTTGRDLATIAKEADRVWGPDGEVKKVGPKTKRVQTRTVAKKAHGPRSNGKAKARADTRKLEKLLDQSATRRAKLPVSQAVELATLAKEPPRSDDWFYEIKFDGYRMLCRIDKGKARFISRNAQDWTKKFPEITSVANGLPVDQAMLDGEVVALDEHGLSHFQALQNAFQERRTGDLVYYVFDILHLNGRDLTGVPLEQRKKVLEALLEEYPQDTIRYSDYLQGTGSEIISQACRLHLEGIIAKRRASVYRPGRGKDWLKIKCSQRAEFVIGGYTSPAGERSHFGAILVGYYDADKHLVYAGRVGTGFNEKMLSMLRTKFDRLKSKKSAFTRNLAAAGTTAGIHWLAPRLVAEVEFSNWTQDGLLRHPSFQGLREDKAASEVFREQAIATTQIEEPKTSRPASRRRKAAQVADHVNGPSPDAFAKSQIAGVTLTHPEKVLYPEQGFTKQDLANYYSAVAEWMLPHVANRPLALVRCPSGRTKPCFFQKHPGDGKSPYLHEIDISTTGNPEYNFVIEDAAGLMTLVQMGVLEIHAWGSQRNHLEAPDRLVFDLDPDPAVEWSQVITAAREVRAALEELGLRSFLKTTGGKGLHIVVPVRPLLDWNDAKTFCHAVVDLIVGVAPDRYVGTMSKAARKGKIYIDYLRNGRGATSVAAYSTRARPGATVSTPISWEELSPRLHSDAFTITNLPARLVKLKKDPWEEIGQIKQSVTNALMKRINAMPRP